MTYRKLTLIVDALGKFANCDEVADTEPERHVVESYQLDPDVRQETSCKNI